MAGAEAVSTVEHESRAPVYYAEAILRRIESCIDRLVDERSIPTDSTSVHDVLGITPEVLAILAVLRIIRIKAHAAIFRVLDIVSAAVFDTLRMGVFFHGSGFECMKIRPHGIENFRIAESVGDLCVLLGRVRYIAYVVRLVDEIRTGDAVMTAFAVIEKQGIAAVIAVARIQKVMASETILYLVRLRALMAKRRVDAIVALLQPVAVETIFIIAALDDDVAVFAVGGEIDVVGVFVVRADEILQGRHAHERSELLKKRSREVKAPSEVERIPRVAPPHVAREDFLRTLGRKDRNYIPTCPVAFSAVEFSFIAKGEPSPVAALRAQRRWRYELFLSI